MRQLRLWVPRERGDEVSDGVRDAGSALALEGGSPPDPQRLAELVRQRVAEAFAVLEPRVGISVVGPG